MSATASAFRTWSDIRPRRRTRLRPSAPPPAVAFHRALPWLLAALLLTMLPLVGHVPAWCLLIFGACTVWRYLLERTGRPLPSLFGRMLIFVPVAYFVLSTYNANTSATGMLAFLIALLSLKILELRTARDFMVASLLGFFMVLAALFYDQSLSLCAYLSVVVLVQTVGLLYCHGEINRFLPTIRLSLGLGLQALPLVALLFLVFPRVQGGFLHRFGGGTGGRTGMSDRLQPGSVSNLAQSNDPVFRATLTPPPGQTINQGQLYWRGAVLDVCDAPLVWRGRPPRAVPSPRRREGVRQDITMFWASLNWLYALDRPTDFQADSPSDLPVRYLQTQTLRSTDPIYKTILYTVYSSPNDLDTTPLDNDQRQRALALPPDIGPRSRALAESWRRQAHSDDDILRDAVQFFGTNGFVYTLTPGLLPGKNALDAFLFESRRGFCEHYAAAYCTLLRTAGVPARVVVGYQGGEYNRWGRGGGHYLVRQSDAHAWAEVWLPKRGWVREDPTALVAPDRVSYGMDSYAALGEGLSGRLRLARLAQLNAPGSLRWALRNASQIWDSVDEQWNQLVLGYNQDTQLSLLERLGLEKLSLFKGTALTLAVALALLVMGGGLIYVFERGGSRRTDPMQRLYARFCTLVAKRSGLIRAPAEGPLDFARRVSSALPAQAPDIRRITDLYVASRYARTNSKNLVDDFRSAVARFRAGPANP